MPAHRSPAFIQLSKPPSLGRFALAFLQSLACCRQIHARQGAPDIEILSVNERFRAFRPQKRSAVLPFAKTPRYSRSGLVSRACSSSIVKRSLNREGRAPARRATVATRDVDGADQRTPSVNHCARAQQRFDLRPQSENGP